MSGDQEDRQVGAQKVDPADGLEFTVMVCSNVQDQPVGAWGPSHACDRLGAVLAGLDLLPVGSQQGRQQTHIATVSVQHEQHWGYTIHDTPLWLRRAADLGTTRSLAVETKQDGEERKFGGPETDQREQIIELTQRCVECHADTA